jgi:enoyl-CoA hydratase/carnithine racemase
MAKHIVKDISGGVLTLTLDRPDKKNAITTVMYAAMADALEVANKDSGVRVVVITGTGDAFTAGNDLKEFIDIPPKGQDAPAFRFMYALVGFKKPVIAAVNGLAIGIGTTMLLHVDFAYAVPEASFAMPFVNLALVPEFASSLLLPRFIGQRKAAELLCTADRFDAKAALDFGLINAVVPAGELLQMARSRALSLASKPPEALRQTKALLRADAEEIKARIALEAKAFAERLQSAELKEAIAAFFEKREADFSKLN